jgi:hypothetical protein
MTSKQRRILASITRAYTFLKLRTFKSARLRGLTKELGDTLDLIHRVAVTQGSDLQRPSTFEVVEYRKAELRTTHLMAISKDGKRLLKGLPGIADGLRVPHMRDGADKLLKAAERIFANVEPHAATFREAGFPRSFLADGRRAAKALAIAAKRYDAEPPTRFSPATRTLKDVLAEGRSIISAIDGHLVAEFHQDRGDLEIWRTAKRIPRHLGRPKRRRPRPGTDEASPG